MDNLKECNGTYLQPEWPEGFGGTAPYRCQSWEKGPHIWIHGDVGIGMYQCKICERGGDDCPACCVPVDSPDPNCKTCCGTGIIPNNYKPEPR